MFPLCSRSLQTRTALSAVFRRSPTLPRGQWSSFATLPRREGRDARSTVVELPPNLIFDPRAKSSPFYGVDRLLPEKKEAKRKDEPRVGEKETAEQLGDGAAAAAAGTSRHEDEDRVGDCAVESSTEMAADKEEDAEIWDDDGEEDDDDEEEEERIL